MLLNIKRVILKRTREIGANLFTRSLEKLHNLSRDEFHKLQEDLLYEMYHHAVRRVPYYKNSTSYPTDLSASNFKSQFSTLPMLHKEQLKEATKLFIKTPRNPFLLRHTTGGTTGSPLEIFQNPIMRMKTTALMKNTHQNFLDLDNPRILNLIGYLTGDTIVERTPLSNEGFLSIYRLHQDFKPQIRAFLMDFQPDVIHGYPSALEQLALLFPDGLPYHLNSRRVRCVSTSETLHPDTKEIIETNLRVIVHNQYGSQEAQHFVFECKERGMHIHPTRGYIEILQFESDNPVAAGEPGRVVVTGLQNRDMPLLRYSIGDTATKAGDDEVCGCGCEWPMLKEVHGRTDDLVLTSDGRRISLFTSILKYIPGIKESQIVQKDYVKFTYRIVTTVPYDKATAEPKIRNDLSERLGQTCDIAFEYVNEIQKTVSGKHRAVVVDFDNP